MKNTADIHWHTLRCDFSQSPGREPGVSSVFHKACAPCQQRRMDSASLSLQISRSVLRVHLWHIQGELWPTRLKSHTRSHYCSSCFTDEQTEPGSPFKVAGLRTYWDQTECSSLAHRICLLLHHHSTVLVKCYVLKEKNCPLLRDGVKYRTLFLKLFRVSLICHNRKQSHIWWDFCFFSMSLWEHCIFYISSSEKAEKCKCHFCERRIPEEKCLKPNA